MENGEIAGLKEQIRVLQDELADTHHVRMDLIAERDALEAKVIDARHNKNRLRHTQESNARLRKKLEMLNDVISGFAEQALTKTKTGTEK